MVHNHDKILFLLGYTRSLRT